MKETRKQTQTESCSTTTAVKTSYARACIILLALNFCLTGYIMLNVMRIQTESISTTVGYEPVTTRVSSPSQSEEMKTDTVPVTLEKKQ